MRTTLTSLTILAALVGAACSSAPAGLPAEIQLDSGLVTGTAGTTADVRVFRGIPYAAPPVGDLRWKQPQPVAHWDGVRAADQFGPNCMQGAGTSSGANEDCLYLNVWTTAKSSEDRLPVMLWIYGGGYNTGSGSQEMYDGDALAQKGAVIVTINYRLGAFGFFSHPELTAESSGQAAANFGLMDAVAALEWTQRNIAAFGGDPDRVTIFGESAGAGLIASVMASPRASGLFHRAIGESSSWTTATINRMQTLEEAEQSGVAFAEGVGATTLAELRAKSADEILAGGRGPGPIVDGVWVPDQVGKIFAEGKQADVPVLVGSNRDESFSATPDSAADQIARVRERFGPNADMFLKVYPATSDEEAVDSAWTAGRDEMAWVMRYWAQLSSTTGTNSAYVYYFTHQPPATPGAKGRFAPTKHGTATHVSEILYVFDHLQGNRAFTEADRKVADLMSSYWVNFAANGDPNGEGLPMWPAFRAGAPENTMMIEEMPHAGRVLSDQQLAVFQAYYDSLYSD